MLVQITFGSLLTLGSFLIAALAWWGLETVLRRLHSWAIRPPHGPKLMSILIIALIVSAGTRASLTA